MRADRLLRRRGFTLVEILVVIALIAVLIAILLPALSAARAHALALKCATNLRALGQAMHLYANDNHGYVPRDYDATDRTYTHVLWAEVLAKHVAQPLDDLPPLPARPRARPVPGATPRKDSRLSLPRFPHARPPDRLRR
jgi:prepilin-type N-terminal cleavage/methylation domain-containing protein